MTQSMTKLGRATRAGGFTSMLAIIAATAVMASVKTAWAWDPQASEATVDDEMNRQAARQGYAVTQLRGAYATPAAIAASRARRQRERTSRPLSDRYRSTEHAGG